MTINSLIGKVFVNVEKRGNEILFTAEDGTCLCMHHEQDSRERVTIEDINGDLSDLIGTPILLADEAKSKEGEPKNDWDESFTWTFYRFGTIKGYVDIRWYGTSNGYYSESVTISEECL